MGHDDSPLRALPLPTHRSVPCGGVLSRRQLREHGVAPAVIADRSRPGGPWQRLLPGVYLLRPGPPTAEQRLRAALLYCGLSTDRVPGQRPVMLTGPAALALHGLACVPAPDGVTAVDVLVPHRRRLRDAAFTRVRRTPELPVPEEIAGLPVAPLCRAVADTVELCAPASPAAVRTLVAEAARTGRCTAPALVRELDRAGLLPLPGVAGAVDALLSLDRRTAEDRVYALVAGNGLPDPVWNAALHLPDGTFLASVDAYWPAQGVALRIDVRPPGFGELDWLEEAGRRERLEALGLTVLHVTPDKLRDAPALQAAVVHTALRIAEEQPPVSPVVALPR